MDTGEAFGAACEEGNGEVAMGGVREDSRDTGTLVED